MTVNIYINTKLPCCINGACFHFYFEIFSQISTVILSASSQCPLAHGYPRILHDHAPLHRLLYFNICTCFPFLACFCFLFLLLPVHSSFSFNFCIHLRWWLHSGALSSQLRPLLYFVVYHSTSRWSWPSNRPTTQWFPTCLLCDTISLLSLLCSRPFTHSLWGVPNTLGCDYVHTIFVI